MSRPEDDPDFMLFWELYARTGPRKVAWECWQAARAGTGKHRGYGPAPAEVIIAGLEAWAAYWRQPGAAAVKWPQGWLNERRWEDAPPNTTLAIQQPASRSASAMAHLRARAAASRPNHGLPAYPSNHGLPAPEGPQGRLL